MPTRLSASPTSMPFTGVRGVLLSRRSRLSLAKEGTMYNGKHFWMVLAPLLIFLSAHPILAASKQGNVYHWNYHTAYDKTYFNGGSHLQSWADRVWEETK